MVMKLTNSGHSSERFRPRVRHYTGHKHKRVTIIPFVPNMITILALCSGLSAVRFALQEQWQLAITAILVAALLDGLDGRIARLLDATSRFGAELDSLSDFIGFGVSPALILYLKSLQYLRGMGWIICLFFSVCMGLRLARFNTLSIEGVGPSWSQKFSVGVPAPAAATLALAPLIVNIEFAQTALGEWAITPLICGLWVIFVGCLAVSRFPTFLLKKITIPTSFMLPILLFVALLAGGVYMEPWITLIVLIALYLGSLPLSIYECYKYQKKLTQVAEISEP